MYDRLSKERKENAPSSIIITTLAAQAYGNEGNLFEALNNIINNMSKYIKKEGDTYIIENPVMPEENFAEKWREHPEKADEFFVWLQSVKESILVEPLKAQGIHKVSESLEHCFGHNVVKKVFVDDGNLTKLARDNKSLYIEGLTGGLKTKPTETTKKVGGHTFFGK